MYCPPKANAVVIFSDSFSGGYNNSLWTIYPGQFAPISSPFGIAIDPQHATDYSSLVYKGILPRDLIIKVDMKINTSPSSDMGIFINNSQTGVWKNAYVFGYGYGGVPNTILLRDSTRQGSLTGQWNNSAGIHHFELYISGKSNTAIVLKEDGVTLGTWASGIDFAVNEIGFSMFGTGSEFANFKLCDSAGCDAPSPTATPTPRPSPTPTSTPTPTPTPRASPTPSPTPTVILTPTPTPIPTSKVVVVPGFGASWNAASLLSCGLIDKGQWILNPLASPVYSPLFKSLSANSYAPIPFYYDWRKQVTQSSQTLKSFIQTHTITGEKIHLLGHSLGGLVGRSYLEQDSTNSALQKFLTVGTPHQGTPLAYYAWSGGEVPTRDLLWKFGATFILKHCGGAFGNDRATIRALIPSIQNLLPTFDYIRSQKSKIFTPVSSMIDKNNWLPTNLKPPFFGVTVGTLAGNGFKTEQFIQVIERSKKDQLLGNWADGKPALQETTTMGDGTILTSSSQTQGAVNTIINSSHNDLVSTAPGIKEILTFFGNSPGRIPFALPPPSSGEPTALVIIANPATMIAADPSGRNFKDTDGFIGFLNPKKGVYKLTIYPTSDTTTVIIGQFHKNDKILWKEYLFPNKIRKLKSLHYSLKFDEVNPFADPLL